MKNITGRRIRDTRISQKMTQRHLAQAADISTSYMNLIESGRRPIGGTLLNNIAKILGTDAARLSDDVSGSLIDQVWSSTAQFGISREELEKLLIEHPKWSKVIQGFDHRIDGLTQQLDEVTNGFNLDNGFSEPFHDLLSRLASIRSTASILNTQGDLSKENESQFRDILHKEARSASDIARDLIANFEQTGRSIGAELSALQSLSTQLFTRQYKIPFLEETKGQISQEKLRLCIDESFGEEASSHFIVFRLFLTFAKDVAAMPRIAFLEAGKKCNWDIEKLSVIFDTRLDRVVRRIAMLSSDASFPQVSLNIYDQMGSPWLLSPLTSFSGYKKTGCALWPIFDKGLAKDQLVKRHLKIDNTEYHQAFAAMGWPDLENDERSDDRISSMISYPSADGQTGAIQAHVECRACHKADCLSRRNRAVLG